MQVANNFFKKTFSSLNRKAILLLFRLVAILFLLLGTLSTFSQTTYYSRATGDWDVNSTWSTIACNGVAAAAFPGAADNIVICANHTVLNTGPETVADLTVNANGIFDMDGANLVVTGDLVLNGQLINGGRLRLDGVNTDIDGLGSSDASIRVEFRVGDKTVLSSANITFGRDIMVQTGITVTNYGTVTAQRNLNGQAGGQLHLDQ